MPKIEGYWDCPYCGSKAIRGGMQACPGCGKTRAADTKFYMLGTEPVADESVVEQGPDWYCPYCDSYNPHSAQSCKNCGHAREETDEDYFALRRRQEQKAAEAAQPEAPARTGRKTRPLLIGLALALVLLVVFGVLRSLPKQRSVTIVDASWTRQIAVEEKKLAEESGWTLPSDAVEVLNSRREIHHYDQVLDHYETVYEERSREVLDGYDTYYTYEDMGNGYFDQVEHNTPRYRTEYYTESHQEPVYVSVPAYETKYYYTVYRWSYERTETASGHTDPAWPAVTYGENEREASRSESYAITYADAKGYQTTFECDYGLWSQLRIGESYSVKLQRGEIVEIG